MGVWISKISKLLEEWGTTHSRIVMLGLDAAGKTTVLYKLKLNETVTTIPTIGFNVEEVKVKGLCFTVWDVGGQDRIRPLWRHYYANSDALIFVVDSNDRERLKEAAHELYHTLEDPDMHGVPVLIFANKQDLPNSVSPSELAEKLCLRNLQHRNKWHIQGSNAVTGDGLYEGLEIVARMCREHRKATTGR